MYGNGRNLEGTVGKIELGGPRMGEKEFAEMIRRNSGSFDALVCEVKSDPEMALRLKEAREWVATAFPPVPYRPGSWRGFCSMWVRGRG
jgi:hypothetical protein